jgi:uncharacterized protein YkwD
MFTLQILDRGQTLLFPLDDRPVRFGRAATVEVVLGEDGVADLHATFVPHAGGARLEPSAPTRRNGVDVHGPIELGLGDRIELGRVVIVVGRTVARPATAADVLAAPPARRAAPAAAAARPLAAATAAKKRNLLPLLVPIPLVGLFAYFALQPGDSEVGAQLAMIANARQKGRVEEVRESIARLRERWNGAADDRLARLAREEAALADVEAAFARLQAKVLDPAIDRTYAQWIQELAQIEQKGAPVDQVAARMVRSDLRATLARRVAPAGGAAGDPVAVDSPNAQDLPNGVATRMSPSSALLGDPTSAPAAQVLPPTVAFDQADVARLCTQGLFAQALELLADAGEAAASTIADVRSQARAAQAQLLQAARQSLAAGKAGDAVALLQGALHRFPATAEFADLRGLLGEAERQALAAAPPSPPTTAPTAAPADGVAAAPAVDEGVRMQTLAAVRAEMDAVRAAEAAGDFVQAAERLAAAAKSVAERDPEFAARLAARAEEAQSCAAFHAAVAASVGAGLRAPGRTSDGVAFELRATNGHRLVVEVAGQQREIGWPDVAAESVQGIAVRADVLGKAALGAAAMLYKLGENGPAELLLAKALRAEPALQPEIDRVVARGRGEPVDGPGYQLGKDGFVSKREVAVQLSADKLAARIDSVLRGADKKAREALVGDVLAGGAESQAILVVALQKELERQVAKIEASPLRKSLEKLDALRTNLDEARALAKELIYDEVRYFYPYKPPAVSSDKYAEYVRTQEEVDRRVEAVRTLWNDTATKVRVPSSLRVDLERLDWAADVIERLGRNEAATLARVDWARALPSGEMVSVVDYCRTTAEREELVTWARVEAYNTIVGKQMTAAQRDLLRLTNDYRAMFRHRPLAAVPTLGVAAQGHADEMSRLGYFSHTSPTPGRRSPFDRMQLAGYAGGASENIALVDGAQGAIDAWRRSSGHHRNMLAAGHTELGCGGNGRYWVQNFGGTQVYRDDPAWAATSGGN